MKDANRIIEQAEKFSQEMEDAFRNRIQNCYNEITYHLEEGEERNESLLTQIDIFSDYLIGTAVGILSQYASTTPGYEAHFIEIVKDKFDRIRTISPYMEGKKNGTDNKP